jgi:chromosome segregation ATPase
MHVLSVADRPYRSEQPTDAPANEVMAAVEAAAALIAALTDKLEVRDQAIAQYEQQMKADRLAWCARLESVDKVISSWRERLEEAEGISAKANANLLALENRCSQAEAREQEALQKLNAYEQRMLAAEKAAIGYKELLKTEVARLTRDAQTLRTHYVKP